uniref:Arabinogalactan endo-beta-1,4-galactanase n=1 Tax=uncultured Dickeya sp. TaxID=741653 RepID=A0A060C9D7_9GAMM|nr:Glyco_hydro_53 [uncultured Dickeya sp.]
MYTYWNGPISALQSNMDDISKRYHKDVIVVEAAYAWTLANCDKAENSFTTKRRKRPEATRQHCRARQIIYMI